MNEVLIAVTGYPGVIATVMLGFVLAYWLFVMLGALDIDMLGGHADGMAEGADGALHGAAKGVAEGVADGAAHGAVKGFAGGAADAMADGAAEGAADAAGGEPEGDGQPSHARTAAELLSIANLRSVPVTVMLSVLVCFGWLMTIGGSRAMLGLGLPLPWWLLGTLVLLLSFVLALVPTALAVRPLARFFVTHQAKAHADLVGKVCLVTTGRVDGKFGQASLQTESMSLLIQVRADDGTALKKGDRALIVSWDKGREAFQVEPYAQVLKGD
jgi:hypothetical protein